MPKDDVRSISWYRLPRDFGGVSTVTPRSSAATPDCLEVSHVVLHVEADVLSARILADEVEQAACRWRLEHLEAYAAARPWLARQADLVIDSTARPAEDVAATIAAAVAPALVKGARPGPGTETP